jgi:hypothetical protein
MKKGDWDDTLALMVLSGACALALMLFENGGLPW